MLQTEKALTGRHLDESDSIEIIQSPVDSFRFLLDFIRRRYTVIIVAIAVALALGLVFILTTPSSFTATSSLIIDTHKLQVFGQQSIFNEMPLDTSAVDSQVEILKSETIALAVIKKMDLADDPEFVRSGSLIGALVDSVAGIFTSAEPISEFSLRRQAVNAFKSRLTVKRAGLTYVILISFQLYNPDRAAQIANAIANAYIDDQLESKYDSARRAGVWLQTRLNELREQASAAESAVVAFKNRNDMVDAGGRTINEQQLAELNSQMLVAQSQTSEARAKLDRVQAVLTSADPETTVAATVTDSLKNDVINKLRSQYLEMAARQADWSSRYGADHLAVVNLRNQMHEIQNSIRNELQRIAQTYKSDLEIATQHEQSLRKQLSDAVAQSQVTSEAQVSLRDLVSNAQTYRALYDNFLQRYMESVQQQSFPVTEARVITAATRPLEKSSPKTFLVLGLAIAVGSILGFAAAAWRDFADRVFRTVQQIENLLQTDCIALVPLLRQDEANETSGSSKVSERIGFRIGNLGRSIKRASQGNGVELSRIGHELKLATKELGAGLARVGGESKFVGKNEQAHIARDSRSTAADALQLGGPQTIAIHSGTFEEIVKAPFSAFSEAIRSVKVAIDQSPTSTGGRIIGFTSSIPNEGKSSVAAAVARWIAQTGAKTLLIDCDLRNPTLSRSLSPRTPCGLLEVLKGQVPLEKAVWLDRTTRMKFLPVATKARLAHSSEILASAQTRKFLDSLRGSFDYILIDFSPLMPIVDARVSTNLVDSYVYIVAWGETRIEFVQRALRSASAVYERLLGVVLNKVNLTAIDRYESGGSYYIHGHYARYGYTE